MNLKNSLLTQQHFIKFKKKITSSVKLNACLTMQYYLIQIETNLIYPSTLQYK